MKQTITADYTVDLSAQTIDFVTPPTPQDVVAVTTLVEHHYSIKKSTGYGKTNW